MAYQSCEKWEIWRPSGGKTKGLLGINLVSICSKRFAHGLAGRFIALLLLPVVLHCMQEALHVLGGVIRVHVRAKDAALCIQ